MNNIRTRAFIKKEAADEILDKVKETFFSEDYSKFRMGKGHWETMDLVIKLIEDYAKEQQDIILPPVADVIKPIEQVEQEEGCLVVTLADYRTGKYDCFDGEGYLHNGQETTHVSIYEIDCKNSIYDNYPYVVLAHK